MGQLGDMLEALNGSRPTFTSVRAVVSHWRNLDLANLARGGKLALFGRPRTRLPGDPPSIEEETFSFWLVPPKQTRIEVHRESHDEYQVIFTVADGERWWARYPGSYVETSSADDPTPCLTDAERHFDGALLREFFKDLALESIGRVQTAGRECLRVRGIPRPNCSPWPHWLPYGADEYEFHADPERAVLLSIIGRYAGQVFETYTTQEVAFDQPIDPEYFTFKPLAGESLCPAGPLVEHMSLEEAVGRVRFTVLVPSWVPEVVPSQQLCMYHPPRRGAPRPVLLMSHPPGEASEHLYLEEGATRDPRVDNFDWEPVEHGGKRLLLSDSGRPESVRLVYLEQDSTHVLVYSNLGRGPTLEYAASLVGFGR